MFLNFAYIYICVCVCVCVCVYIEHLFCGRNCVECGLNELTQGHRTSKGWSVLCLVDQSCPTL